MIHVYTTSILSAEPAHPPARSDQSLHRYKHDVFVLKLFAKREEILLLANTGDPDHNARMHKQIWVWASRKCHKAKYYFCHKIIK